MTPPRPILRALPLLAMGCALPLLTHPATASAAASAEDLSHLERPDLRPAPDARRGRLAAPAKVIEPVEAEEPAVDPTDDDDCDETCDDGTSEYADEEASDDGYEDEDDQGDDGGQDDDEAFEDDDASDDEAYEDDDASAV